MFTGEHPGGDLLTARRRRSQRDGLGSIKGGATAQSNHAVTVLVEKLRDAGLHMPACGVAINFAVKRVTEAVVRQQLSGSVDEGQAGETPVGDAKQ